MKSRKSTLICNLNVPSIPFINFDFPLLAWTWLRVPSFIDFRGLGISLQLTCKKFLRIKFKYKDALLVQRGFFVCAVCFIQTRANMLTNKTVMWLQWFGFLTTHFKWLQRRQFHYNFGVCFIFRAEKCLTNTFPGLPFSLAKSSNLSGRKFKCIDKDKCLNENEELEKLCQVQGRKRLSFSISYHARSSHRRFYRNFPKFFRIAILQNTFHWMFLMKWRCWL